MAPELYLTASTAVALVAVTALVPVAVRVSYATGFLDRPAGWKSHVRATPMLGGTAVVLAFCLGSTAASNDIGRVAPILGAALALGLLGTIDDRRSLRARHKLPPELAAGVLAWLAGFRWQLGGPAVLDLTVTTLWVVAVINATNLVDLMDGVAATVTLVAVTAVATLAAIQGDVAVACASCALAGACLGFLRYNLASPARIFLGDGGTIPIGFATAVLTMGAIGAAKGGSGGLLAGMLLFGAPLLDMAMRITLRVRRGVSIMTAGPDSAANLLRDRLPSARAVAFAAGAIQAGVSAAAVAAIKGWWPAAVVALLLAVAMSVVCFLLVKPVALAPGAPGGATFGDGRLQRRGAGLPGVDMEPPGAQRARSQRRRESGASITGPQ